MTEHFFEVGPDDFRKADLAEQNPMWAAVADALYEWKGMHVNDLHMSLYGSEHGVGAFLEDLAASGYRIEPIDPGPPLDQLLGPATD